MGWRSKRQRKVWSERRRGITRRIRKHRRLQPTIHQLGNTRWLDSQESYPTRRTVWNGRTGIHRRINRLGNRHCQQTCDLWNRLLHNKLWPVGNRLDMAILPLERAMGKQSLLSRQNSRNLDCRNILLYFPFQNRRRNLCLCRNRRALEWYKQHL